jgi:acyl dehydratase
MNVDRLLGYHFEEFRQEYTNKDTILYALGIGLGSDDPTDPRQLQFLYEDGLVAFPTLALVLAYPGFWISRPEFEVDWKGVLHGEQAATFHKPIPSAGVVRSVLTVDAIVDKGPKGAFVYSRRDLFDLRRDDLLVTQRQITICRNDGGLPSGLTTGNAPERAAWVRPGCDPDVVSRITVPRNAALLYRLNGDWNPLHADPTVARQAGFEQPILHGLCTFGIAGRAIVESVCGHRADRLRHLETRFSSPVYPGDTLVTSIWIDSGDVLFEATTERSQTTVLSQGRARVD